MKQFKKFITVGYVFFVAFSVMSVGVLAKTDIPMENGDILTIYEENENYTGDGSTIVEFDFNQSFHAYPDFDFLKTPYAVNYVDNVIPLSMSENEIRINFSEKPTSIYISVYDTTTDEYVTSGTYGLIYLCNISSEITISDLQPGHSYSLRFASEGIEKNISGTISMTSASDE